jgi:hypothetical protein
MNSTTARSNSAGRSRLSMWPALEHDLLRARDVLHERVQDALNVGDVAAAEKNQNGLLYLSEAARRGRRRLDFVTG